MDTDLWRIYNSNTVHGVALLIFGEVKAHKQVVFINEKQVYNGTNLPIVM